MDMDKKVMEVTLEQQKLISSPLRAKIIFLLATEPMTAKQVADEMERSAGSIHYHIQQLFNEGILELAETRNNKGIIEKYYRSVATQFRLKDELTPKDDDYFMQRATNISLSESELEEFTAEYDALVKKYIKKTIKKTGDRTPFHISCRFKKLEGEEE